MRLLLVEDDPRLLEVTERFLVQKGWAVDAAETLAAARDAVRSCDYDAMILDLALPDGDGMQLLRALRLAQFDLPIIIVSAKGRIGERVAGLDAGADDYLVKPFAPQELHSRLLALCRRRAGGLTAALELGPLRFNQTSRSAEVQGRLLPLTKREGMVLETLMRRAGRPISREQIEAAISDHDRPLDPNTVVVAISRLRTRLAEMAPSLRIETVRGVGYRIYEADA